MVPHDHHRRGCRDHAVAARGCAPRRPGAPQDVGGHELHEEAHEREPRRGQHPGEGDDAEPQDDAPERGRGAPTSRMRDRLRAPAQEGRISRRCSATGGGCGRAGPRRAHGPARLDEVHERCRGGAAAARPGRRRRGRRSCRAAPAPARSATSVAPMAPIRSRRRCTGPSGGGCPLHARPVATVLANGGGLVEGHGELPRRAGPGSRRSPCGPEAREARAAARP